MNAEATQTLILGAGPSGLAAGYTLAQAGIKPVILERDAVSGGLMRSIRRGEFIVDVGRKELYNRLARVDAFWSGLLGEDYRSYVHRGGLLFDGRIIDMSPAYQGVRRGMPWGMFIRCAFDFFRARAKPGTSKPRNLEEYWYQQRGRLLTQITNQGFQEKLHGKRWVDVPMPPGVAAGTGGSFATVLKQGLQRTFSKKENNTHKGIWRHPARGTGQICEALEKGILKVGGRIHYQARVLGMSAVQGKIVSVTAETPSGTVEFNPVNLISSAPAEFLERFLLPPCSGGEPAAGQASPRPQRVAVLVYLFIDAEPMFPHFWLQVTCQKTRIGRITNYAALNADMVPRGKTCLCCEFYCDDDDPLLKLDDKQFAGLALEDCSKSNLLDRGKCFDSLVLRLPGADASQNRHNWLNRHRQRLHAELRQFENLYAVNRTDLDISTLAGMEAAEAVLSGDRTQFDLHVDLTQLGIRSEPKPFEFRNPTGVEI